MIAAEHAVLELGNGSTADVVSFGKMRLVDLALLAWGACISVELAARAGGWHVVTFTWQRHARSPIVIETSARSLEGAVELALLRLSAVRDAAGVEALA